MFVVLTLAVANHLEPFPGEVGLVEWVNGWPRPIGLLLEAVMVLGTLVGALVVLAIVLVATARRWPRAGIALSVAILLGYVTDDVVKRVLERPRPSVVLTTLTVRDHPGGTSYPSGHTTLAFAVALALLPILPPRWRPVPLALAAGVGVARMYVGVHWPTDVVGGAALGTILGAVVVLVVHGAAAPDRAGDEHYGPDHP